MSGFTVYWMIGAVLAGGILWAPGLRKRFRDDPDLQVAASWFQNLKQTHGPDVAGGVAAALFLMATLFWLPAVLHVIMRQDQ